MRIKIPILIAIFTQLSAQAQEVFKHTFLFESGKHSISGNNDRLIVLLEDIDMMIDSIRLIGYTDTVGRIDKNKKLADRRIQSVVNYIQPYFSDTVPLRTINKGERSINRDYRDRRVDVLVYYKKLIIELTHHIKIDTSSTPCFKLAKNIIDYSKQDTIVIENTQYMRLSTPFVPNPDEDLYYCNDTGASTHSVVKIVWVKYKRKESTIFKYYTLIPLKSYNQYRIFTLDRGPCHACHLNSPLYSPVNGYKEVEYLKDKIEYKKIPFTRNKLMVRIPTHLISNANSLKYLGQDVKWLQKSNERYLYTKVVGENRISEICLERFFILTEHCVKRTINPSRSYSEYHMPMCGGVLELYQPRSIDIELLGGLMPYNSWGGHAALNIDLWNYRDRFKVNFLAGLNIDKKLPLYSALRMTYGLFNRNIYSIGRYFEWSSGAIRKKGEINILIGSELKTRSTLMPGYAFSYLSFTYRMEKLNSMELFIRAGASYFNHGEYRSYFTQATLVGINFPIKY